LPGSPINDILDGGFDRGAEEDGAMRFSKFNQGLMGFIQQSPTPFHAVTNLVKMLADAGFSRLQDDNPWQLKKGGKYFVTRNDSAIVAFSMGDNDLSGSGIRLTGAHTDSPCLKVKPNPEIHSLGGYVQLGLEVYGGALLNPWFDRDLSLAGRVDFRTSDNKLDSCLIDLQDPVAYIPSLAIHLDREANNSRSINAQKDLPALLLLANDAEKFSLDHYLLNYLQSSLGLSKAAKILSHELNLYDSQPPQFVGLEKQFIAAARLDNLLSCYLNCVSLIDADGENASVMVCNDHEEVGSASAAGAQGPFLAAVLKRMVASQGEKPDAFECAVQRSVLLSIDNAHGVHPNFPEKHDSKHRPMLNGGPVIKINANQRYASNSTTVALFKNYCEQQGVAYQSFAMRSDMACGSTIGPLTAAETGITTVDIGVPTFAMHSIRELAGAEDAGNLNKVVTAFYNR